ncbi:MAG: hypothetical protein JWM40_2925 [Frankiales bacterium]|nr:hypothetical protein [Frankiales bacterium]
MTQPTDPTPPPGGHDVTTLEILVAGLASRVGEVAQVGRDLLRQSVLTRVQRIVIAAVLFFLVISASASVVALGILLNNSSSAKAQRDEQTALSQTIVDCTQPGGACYERNQTNLAGVIAQLNRNTVIAVECGDAYNGQVAISACVTRRLKEQP